MKTIVPFALFFLSASMASPRQSVQTPPSINASKDAKEYRVGSDDLLDVAVFEIPELSGTARVTASGMVTLPYIGAIDTLGRTPQELARAIEAALRTKHVNDPHVTVFVREYGSQPVSVIGAVRVPGIYQIKGQKLLLDILAMAQGLADSAGKTIQVIRRKEDGSVASNAQSGNDPEADTIKVDVAELFQNGDTSLNIPIYAGDVVNVLNAGSIFAVGEFQHPGEFTLRYGRDVTVTQAVALGGGTNKDAKKSEAMIIRPHKDGTKEQIPLNLTKIFDGSQQDFVLQQNDVIFVPANKVKAGLNRALDSVVTIVIGRAMYLGR